MGMNMGWHRFVRQLHRWVSIVFTATVIGVFASQALGSTLEWVYFTPLLPLLVMILSGLYLFALPYFSGGRRAAQAAGDRQ